MLHIKSTTNLNSQKNPDKVFKGRHMLYAMMGFFSFMFVANGIFLYHAINSFPGEETKQSYIQGLNYNDVLAAKERQDNLGWQLNLGHSAEQFLLTLNDKKGRALANKYIYGKLRKIGAKDETHMIVFHSLGKGNYATSPQIISPGRWDFIVEIADGDSLQVTFTGRKEFIIP